MLKIGIFGVTAALLALVLKKEKEEFAVLMILAAGIMLFAYAVAQVAVVMEFIQGIMAKLPFDSDYLMILLKMLGITYVGEFAASICQDAGYQSIAGQIQVFAKLSIVILSLPCLSYFVDVVESFL